FTLHIIASNHHQYWQQHIKSINITVLPPPWKTWWAYLLYCLVVLFVIWASTRAMFRANRQRLLIQLQKNHDQRVLNQQLKQVDKLKDQFLANTSHELRTPLNGIIGLAESLIDGATGELPAATKTNLAMVVSSGRRLSNLVNDILDFSKLKNQNLELNRQAIDLHSLAEIVVTLSKPLLDTDKVQLFNNIDPKLPAAYGDENRLEQVLHNLVGNAIKFTERGCITVNAELEGSLLTINVSDTGIGIDSANFDSIFNMFEQLEEHQTRHYSGTGLGLAVSKQLIELHGGTIELASTLGVGSTFSFTLPITTEQAQNITDNQAIYRQTISHLRSINEPSQPIKSTKPVNRGFKGEKFCILVVDDEPVNRQVINNILSLQHYRLVEVAGGEQALAALRNDGPFDLVLLDIMMPKISGYEVCRQLRKTYPVNDLPVIFLTAKNQVSDLVESFAIGGNDYLTKPVIKHELMARVETHLKLVDINKNLEQKVADRTNELENSLTQLKAAQEQLIETAKMASLGNLVAGVAHEVNTPLGICITAVSLNIDKITIFKQQVTAGKLTRKGIDKYISESHEQQTLVEQNLHRAANLITQFKKVAVEQSDDQSCEHNFHQYLEQVIASMQTQLAKTNIAVSLISSGDWKLSIFPGAWFQIITNLMENSLAHGFSDQQGCHIKMAAILEQDQLIFSYSDNGHGMDEKQIENIYEPFFTTIRNQGGTGLGMHIVYNLVVHKLKGSIECHSAKDQGVEFTITVPL
ncbi:MAG: response regulator, partial [Algicola sp.]|nr:response regulator [Algicola sp.]